VRIIKYYLGIDPGLNGGFTLIDENYRLIDKFIMPVIKIGTKKQYDVNDIIKKLRHINLNFNPLTVIEESRIRPISGKRSCFMLGFGYATLLTLLKVLDFRHEIVSPQVWMKALGITSKDVKGSIIYCQRFFPTENWTISERAKKPHDGLTDSAAIAVYAIRRVNYDKDKQI